MTRPYDYKQDGGGVAGIGFDLDDGLGVFTADHS